MGNNGGTDISLFVFDGQVQEVGPFLVVGDFSALTEQQRHSLGVTELRGHVQWGVLEKVL